MGTLPKTNGLPRKIGRAPEGNDRIPSIHFQVRTVSFREGRSWEVYAMQIQEIAEIHMFLFAPEGVLKGCHHDTYLSILFCHQDDLLSGRKTVERKLLVSLHLSLAKN